MQKLKKVKIIFVPRKKKWCTYTCPATGFLTMASFCFGLSLSNLLPCRISTLFCTSSVSLYIPRKPYKRCVITEAATKTSSVSELLHVVSVNKHSLIYLINLPYSGFIELIFNFCCKVHKVKVSYQNRWQS